MFDRIEFNPDSEIVTVYDEGEPQSGIEPVGFRYNATVDDYGVFVVTEDDIIVCSVCDEPIRADDFNDDNCYVCGGCWNNIDKVRYD